MPSKDLPQTPKGHFSHKQKKEKLQLQRERRKEPRPELVSLRVPKAVQARLYTYRAVRGGEVHVRMRLAIDRQQCRGFVPGRAAAGPSEPAPPAERASQKPVQPFAARAMSLRAALSKLDSKGSDHGHWLHALEGCIALTAAIALVQTTGAQLRAVDLFGLLQQALQTGPLSAAKPARFKRIATHTRGEYIDAIQRLLAAVTVLLHGEGAAALTERQRDASRQWQADFARWFPEQ
jgi:hypothetical protein